MQENPSQLHQEPLHSKTESMWYAVASFWVISPYFFEDEGITITESSADYTKMC
jgi:hypothetical protein